MSNYYVPGEWNAVCDICGFQFKASKLRQNWKGQRVCEHDFETRHPQDLLRVRVEDPSVPWTSPDITSVTTDVGAALYAETSELLTDETGSPLLEN